MYKAAENTAAAIHITETWITQRLAANKCATNAVLLVNNLSAVGGEAAITVLTKEENLVEALMQRLRGTAVVRRKLRLRATLFSVRDAWCIVKI